MHRHLYRNMDSFQRLAFCALAAVLMATALTGALKFAMG